MRARSNGWVALGLVAVLLVAAGCGGGDGDGEEASDRRATTTSPGGGDGESTTTAFDLDEATTTTAGGSTGTVSGSGGDTGAAGTPTTAGGSSAPGPAGGTSAIAPPAAGTYRYRLTGSGTVGPTPQQVDEEATLAVEPPNGSRQRSVQRTSQGSTTTVLEYRADGVFLVELAVDQSGVRLRFAPPQPVLAVPAPAAEGQTWAFDMTSDDGCVNSHTDGRVGAASEPQDVGGQRLDAARLDVSTTLKPTGKAGCSALDATQQVRMWVSAEHRLVLREEETTRGTFSGFPFTSETTAVLQSTTPS